MAGRSYSSGSYRYGFNGKEKVDEITGSTGTDYDFGARIYDARLGKFLSVDPDIPKYPFMSSYCFAANNPIELIDVDGRGPVLYFHYFGPSSFSWYDHFFASDYYWNPYKSPAYNITNRFATSLAGRMAEGAIDGVIFAGSYLSSSSSNGLPLCLGIGLPNSHHPGYYRYDFRFGLSYHDWKPITEFNTEETISFVGGVLTFLSVGTSITKNVGLSMLRSRWTLAAEWEAEMAYINFDKQVYTKTLEEGEQFLQFRLKGLEGTKGSYYAPLGTTPEQIGLEASMVGETNIVTVSKPTKVLFSTHKAGLAPYYNPSGPALKGGGTQILSRELKKNATFTPAATTASPH